jgi:hypothetical protein
VFNIRLLSPDGFQVHIPHGWEFEVNRYSDHAIGGPESADIDISAQPDALWACLNWLGYDIEIYSPDGTLTWWGYVDEATVQLEGIAIGMTLSGMYNRVRVAYSTEDASGSPVQGHTAWAQDDTSVSRYGVKELQHSADNTTLTQAEALRDRILDRHASPARVVRVGGGSVGAKLRCRGHWERTAWQYYENLVGIEEYLEGGGKEALSGWALTGTDIAFDAISNKIHHHGAALDLLESGDTLQVTGSTSNNSAFGITGSVEDEAQKSYTASTIYFDPSDDIHDSASGFVSNLDDKQLINVSGSSSNNGYRIIKSLRDPDHMTVHPGTIVTEAAGASITITHGNSVPTSDTPVTEMPSASITLTAHGVRVAQGFNLDTGFDLHKAAVQVRKLGNPADDITVGIYTDSSGPSVLLGSATLANADIPAFEGAWAEVIFSPLVTLTASTYYWIVVERDGANSSTDCYRVGINDDEGREGYRGASYFTQLSDGSAWHTLDADMPFRLIGGVETSDQIAAMGTASSHLDTNDVQVSSGVTTNQYRDGDTTIQDEIIDLIEQGTSSGSQLLCRVSADKIFSVYAKPDSTSIRWLLSNDGTVRNAAGTPVRAGQLVAGTWVDLAEAPRYPGLTPFFAVRSEYNVRGNRLTIEPEGMPSPMDFGIQQG